MTGGQLDIQGGQRPIQAAQGITYNFGEGDKAISVVSDIAKVTTVACSRTFTTGKHSTMMLPFSIAAGNVRAAGAQKTHIHIHPDIAKPCNMRRAFSIVYLL